MTDVHIPRVMWDHNKKTCIELSRKGSRVIFVPMDSIGIAIEKVDAGVFDRTYTPVPNYPVAKAARRYIAYASSVGGTESAMEELAKLTTLTSKELIEMAIKKKAAVSTTKAEAAAKAKANSKKAPPAKSEQPKPPKQAKAEVTKATKVTKTKETKVPRRSASKAFQELIMAGTLTEKQIFARVQKEFGLDDSKFSYVKWNYNYLVKQGSNPPELK